MNEKEAIGCGGTPWVFCLFALATRGIRPFVCFSSTAKRRREKCMRLHEFEGSHGADVEVSAGSGFLRFA